ncbi:MAG: AAA family ATPase, partial [Deltaproteobacteria bacterium]|nr:AAA family ATPase [Deltaproteobacteria bacterium]
MPPRTLKAEELTCACNPQELERGPVGEEPPVLPGQQRGLDALEFGLAVRESRFNITATGQPLSGKTPTVKRMVEEVAGREPPSTDICLRFNFKNPLHPLVMYLPPGGGLKLNRFIEELLSLLDKQIPKLLEQPSVKAHIQSLKETADEKEQVLSRQVEKFSEELGLVIQATPTGVNLIPLAEGKPMSEEDYLSLSVAKRQEIDAKRKEVLSRMAEVNPKIMALEKESREALEAYIESSISELVHIYMSEMRKLLTETPEVTVFLNELEQEIVAKRFLFLSETIGSTPFGGAHIHALRQQFLKNAKLNVLVDRSGQTTAPVVMEISPTYVNLIGGVDYTEEHGVLKTDFSQIRAGSLLQASGGYLIMQVVDLIQQPLAYQAMKRALRGGKIKLQDPMAEYGLRSTAHMEPDLIVFNTKVILVGDETLVHMMRNFDDEFSRLFKINSDFSGTLVRTPEVMGRYMDYLHYHASRTGLLPMSRQAMARLIEESSRQVSHQGRLSAQMTEMMDIVTEANVLARQRGLAELDRDVVDKALANREYRHGKIEELVKREISEGTILLDFKGSKVGQVNALAVYSVGQVMFGVPTRITAQAYGGQAGIINIEREADLSGKIHTKGMLILNGYLGNLFARNHPLSLSVSICFEQNYGYIEGDSATVAEFLATIS